MSIRSVDAINNAPRRATPTGRARPRSAPRASKSTRAVGQKWTRQLHSWLSMTSLLVVLFFAITGITLNHPTWFGASDGVTATVTGTLPAATVGSGTVDPLAISEYLRSNAGVTGQVTAHAETATGGTIDYEGPGSTAAVAYTSGTGAYSLRTTSYGLVGVLNDLHKGRHTGSSFSWVIDVSGGLLTLVALTGLILQLYVRRSRRLGLVLAGAGAAAGIAFMVLNR